VRVEPQAEQTGIVGVRERVPRRALNAAGWSRMSSNARSEGAVRQAGGIDVELDDANEIAGREAGVRDGRR
jgi:hypothetical protein